MLVDAEHGLFQARVSGDEQFDGTGLNSTIGAVRSHLRWTVSSIGLHP